MGFQVPLIGQTVTVDGQVELADGQIVEVENTSGGSLSVVTGSTEIFSGQVTFDGVASSAIPAGTHALIVFPTSGPAANAFTILGQSSGVAYANSIPIVGSSAPWAPVVVPFDPLVDDVVVIAAGGSQFNATVVAITDLPPVDPAAPYLGLSVFPPASATRLGSSGTGSTNASIDADAILATGLSLTWEWTSLSATATFVMAIQDAGGNTLLQQVLGAGETGSGSISKPIRPPYPTTGLSLAFSGGGTLTLAGEARALVDYVA